MGRESEIQYDTYGNPVLPQGIFQVKRKKVIGFGYHYGVLFSNIFPNWPVVVVDLDNEDQIKARYFTEWLRGKKKWWLCGYCPPESMQQALLRLVNAVQTNKGYEFLTNNCEHFANWIVDGSPRSFQIEAGMKHVRRVAQVALMQLVRQIPRFL